MTAHDKGVGAPCVVANVGWHKNRILFLLAGTMTLVATALDATVSQWFMLVPAMVGANQLLMVAVGWCPISLLLDRLGVAPSRHAPDPSRSNLDLGHGGD